MVSDELCTMVRHRCAQYPPSAAAAEHGAPKNVSRSQQKQQQQKPAKKKVNSGARRPKVLLIHGFTQNASVFSSRTSNFRRKALKIPGAGKFDFVFAESTLCATAALAAAGDNALPLAEQRAWYNPSEADGTTRPVGSASYTDWEAPLKELQALAEAEGPIAGIVAFSQGGVPASILAAQLGSTLRFAIFVGCFAPTDPAVVATLSSTMDSEFVGVKPIAKVPTLHVIGTADPFVSQARCGELVEMCENAKLLTHDGGHIMVPKELFGDVKAWLAEC